MVSALLCCLSHSSPLDSTDSISTLSLTSPSRDTPSLTTPMWRSVRAVYCSVCNSSLAVSPLVVMWTISWGIFALPLYLAASILISPPPPPPHKGVNDFALLVRTSVKEETNQLCLVVRLQLEYGIIRYSTLLHLFLSRFTNSYLPSICCAFPTPQYWCQWNNQYILLANQ